ncbi:MAG: thioesterase family protein [Planctomycetes bacterium]|nr:thioesterase family protein [Planctomycetota bacterium]
MGTVLDDVELRGIEQYYTELEEKALNFSHFLNLAEVSPDLDNACLSFSIRKDFIGNVFYQSLHGGIIASVLDMAGAHAVFFSVFKQVKGQPLEKQFKRYSNIGSIDLRIDYLRPGKGTKFLAKASILRTGRKVAVTRMELHNEDDKLIAVGTGTYTVD